MSDDDDWGITPNYKNTMTEQEQRFGVGAVPGRVDHIDMDQLRKSVIEADAQSKRDSLPTPSYGYGGKFGIEKDRMDKSAVGNEYHAELNRHASQQDYSKGFGGKYGIEKDRQDKAAVGYDHHEKLSKHSSQKDYSLGFGGKYGVQSDRVDISSVGYKDDNEPPTLHQSQKRVEVVSGENRARELRERFEKLALGSNKPVERPVRPSVGKINPGIFAQPKAVETNLQSRPTNVKSLGKKWTQKTTGFESPQPETSKTVNFGQSKLETPKAEALRTLQPLAVEAKKIDSSASEYASSPLPQESSQEIYVNLSEHANESEKNAEIPPSKAEPESLKHSAITAIAIYDFDAAQSDELSFKEGDKIVDIVKFDEAWWSGRIENRIGLFPANRVEEISVPQTVKSITAMALYDFVASQSDELSFKAGDEIIDIVKFDAEWWSGRVGDRSGIFPANHVSEN